MIEVIDSKTQIKVKYFRGVQKIEKIAVGDWVDLRSAEDVEMKAGEFRMFPLGVAMQLPENDSRLGSLFLTYAIHVLIKHEYKPPFLARRCVVNMKKLEESANSFL